MKVGVGPARLEWEGVRDKSQEMWRGEGAVGSGRGDGIHGGGCPWLLEGRTTPSSHQCERAAQIIRIPPQTQQPEPGLVSSAAKKHSHNYSDKK